MPGKEIKGTSKIANYRHGGRAGFSRGGGSAPFLRGQSGSSNLKSPRGYEGMKRILEADKSTASFKNLKKIIKKTPDKKINKSQKKKIIEQQQTIKSKMGEDYRSPIVRKKGGKV